ncbi:hypothetical protein TEA_022133 [Camellia sinensis var. sinensis]|uniref:K Homology domain-containing protein n=1 Tax=Camellia sinensis var. sinensis TaxID=542762 RepID=A0A4S4DUD0_CAMSN|nr:hypothetical protein TEA_022133 [Camellia sinensis var. sinensis]
MLLKPYGPVVSFGYQTIALTGLIIGKECSFHHSLNYKWKMAGAKDRQSVMDWKKQKTVTPIWRPVCTKSSSSEVKELQVEFEDLHDVGKCGKQEDGIKVQEVHASISSSALDAQHTHEDGEAANGATDPTFNSRAFLDNDEERAPGSGSVHSDEKHSVSVEVGASLMRFIKGKWGSTQKKIEEDMGVKIIFPSSRKEDSIIIEGISTESLTKASERVQVIIDEAVKSPNLDYSHFISLPLAIHPELVDKLLNFQKSILGTSNANEDENLGNDSNGDTSEDEDKEQELVGGSDVAVKLKVEDDNKHVKVDITNICRVSYPPRASKPSEQKASKSSALSDLGIEKSIFIKPKTFHLTVLMLKLWNKDRVDAAAEVLQSVSSEVLEALDSLPVSVRLKGLEYMRGSLAKARVVYAPVELHATVMNARHRKRGQWKRKFDSFDARGIFKQFGSEEWGEYLIREAHLSQSADAAFALDIAAMFGDA